MNDRQTSPPSRFAENRRNALQACTYILGGVYGLAGPIAALAVLINWPAGANDSRALLWCCGTIGIGGGIIVGVVISGKAVLRRFLAGFVVGFCLLLLGIGLLIGTCFFAATNFH